MLLQSELHTDEIACSSSLLAYTAGMIDADGCIGIAKAFTKTQEKYTPRIDVSQNQKGYEMLVELQEEFGGGVYRQRRGSETQLAQYVWTLYGKRCGLLLADLLPHLRVKHRQAEVALLFWRELALCREAEDPTWSTDMVAVARTARSEISDLNRLGP